jgi:hypothetical protein
VAIAGMRETAREVTTWIPTATEVANHVLVGSERVQQVLSRLATPLYPALLALEALAACALAWALYHRLSRARLGAALGPVRSFTFSDQLAWALIAGITMLLVPSLAALALVGLNLVVFFGALYVLRGYGIYAWIVSRRAAVTSLVVAIALYPVSLVTVPAALGLGLTDTVLDWRKRLTTSTTGQGGAPH